MAKLFKQALVSSEVICLNQLTNNIIDAKSNEETINNALIEELKYKAYQEGYTAGILEGEILEKQQMADLKKQLETILSSIPQAVTNNRLSLSSEIADIVLYIAQNYFTDPKITRESLETHINQILGQLNSEHTIELSMHPQEIKALQEGVIVLKTTPLNQLKIKGDSTLALGGCVIKTEHGLFDISIERQIDRLKEFLLQLKMGGQHNAPQV